MKLSLPFLLIALTGSTCVVLEIAKAQTLTEPLMQTLRIYTSEKPSDVHVQIAAFKKLNPNLNVELLTSSTAALKVKIDDEFKNDNSKADLIWLADRTYFEKLVDEKRLLRVPLSFRGVTTKNVYASGQYYEVRGEYAVIAVNIKKYAGDLPQYFKDLRKPQFKNTTVLPNPSSSSSALLTLGTLVERNSWNYVQDLKTNGLKIEASATIALSKFVKGQYKIAIASDHDVRLAQEKGVLLDTIYPRDGAIQIPAPIGILKTSKNPELARKFLGFLYSREGQKNFSQLSYVPVVTGAVRPVGVPERFNSVPAATGYVEQNALELNTTFKALFDLK